MINKAKRQKKLRKSRKSNPILKSNPLFPFLTQDGEKFFQDQVSMTGSDSVDPIQTYSQMLNPYLGNSMFACCDTLFVFDNQKLYQMIAKESPEGNENIPMTEVFQKAGKIIHYFQKKKSILINFFCEKKMNISLNLFVVLLMLSSVLDSSMSILQMSKPSCHQEEKVSFFFKNSKLILSNFQQKQNYFIILSNFKQKPQNYDLKQV